MVERVATLPGGIDEHAEILTRRPLADKLVEALGAQRGIDIVGAAGGGEEAIGVSHFRSS
jgi:hypothetical protein